MIAIQVFQVIAFSALAFAAGSSLRGNLTSAGITAFFPGDSNYASASTAYNLRFSFQPAAIAYPQTPQEVSELVKLGVQYNLQVAARSGGHSYIASGLGGRNGVLVVDLSKLKKITVVSSTNTAVIETGNRLGDIALTLNKAGRALPHGTCPYVGIGGHSGYGGFGFTSRKWGLTLDTIKSINMVKADGSIITASSSQNSDLFWAMRGSAGSFGITTSIEVTTFPVPPSATAFSYQWDMSVTDAANGLTAFQSFVQTNIPAEFGAEISLGKGSASGRVSFYLVGGWYGPAAKFNATVAPLLAKLPKNPTTTLKVGSYINSLQFFAGSSLNTATKPDAHDTFYAKSLMTPASSPMSTAAIKAFMKYLGNEGFSSATSWFCQVELYGGANSAINAVPADATAFAHRSSTFTIQFYASSSNSQPPYPNSGLTFVDGMVNSIVSNSPSNWNYGAYPNYIDNRLQNWQSLYYGSHYQRLQSLKKTYDPKDMFAFPTSITA